MKESDHQVLEGYYGQNSLSGFYSQGAVEDYVKYLQDVSMLESDYEYDCDEKNSILGRGAFGVTRRKIHKIMKGAYAIKEIDIRKAELQLVCVGSLINEAKILFQLRHNNIVKYITCYFSNDKQFFNVVTVLETGGTIASKIKDSNSESSEDIAKWWGQLSNALHYLHFDQKIQHRDNKPSNLLLSAVNDIIIIDFGFACTISATSKVGTTNYFSYEKANSMLYDGRDDVWAAGCVMAELITKQPLTAPIFDFQDEAVNSRRQSMISACISVNEVYGDVITRMLALLQEYRCNSEDLFNILKGETTVPSSPISPIFSRRLSSLSSASDGSNPSSITDPSDIFTQLSPHTSDTNLLTSELTSKNDWRVVNTITVNYLYGSFISFLNHDGTRLITKRHSDKYITLWSATGKTINNISCKEDVILVGFNLEDEVIIITKSFIGLFSSNLDDVKEVLTDENNIACDKICRAYATPSGSHLYTSYKDGTIRVWDLFNKTFLFTIQAKETFHVLDMDNKGQVIVGGSLQGPIRIWNVTGASGSLIRVYREHKQTVCCVKLSSDLKRMVSGSEDKTVIIWCLATVDILFQFTEHSDVVNSVCWSSDDSIVLSSSNDKFVKVWNSETGELIQNLKSHSLSVDIVCMSHDRRVIVTTSSLSMRVWK